MIPFLRGPIIYTKPIIPGSASYTSPGTYSLIVPAHHTMTFDVRGGGGGGGGPGGTNPNATGGTGGIGGYSQVYYNPNSSLLNIIGYGGGGGSGSYGASGPGSAGASGTATGGDSNYTGGGAGGGSGGHTYNLGTGNVYGGNGGYGGRAVRTASRGILVPSQSLIIIVGGGGAAGQNAANGNPYVTQYGAGSGVGGAVYISWN